MQALHDEKLVLKFWQVSYHSVDIELRRRRRSPTIHDYVKDIIMFKIIGKIQARKNSPINRFPNNEKMRKAFRMDTILEQFLVKWPGCDTSFVGLKLSELSMIQNWMQMLREI
jgi:hypothetical protein